MASLGNGGEDNNGYLGNSSGYSLLRTVSNYLPPHGPGDLAGEQAKTTATDRQARGPGAVDSIWLPHLSATAVQDQLVSAYFLCYNSSYPILHERTFRQKCSARSQVPRDSSWHIVYFMVLAIGEWVMGYCNDEHSLYYDAARSRFRIETLESGNTHNVQAFLLMGNYLQKRDRPNTGFNFIGIAYRMALGLGLHRETVPVPEKKTFALHRRRVLFWALYCFDSGFSITTGRPVLVSDSFIDVRSPSNIDESQCDINGELPAEVSYPTTCSALIHQSRLAKIANKVYGQFMSVIACPDVGHQTSVMEQLISNWRSSLPQYFFRDDVPEWFLGARQIVFWKEMNLRMLLLIASGKHHIDEHDKIASGKRYRAVAAETIGSISDICKCHSRLLHPGLTWYAIYFLLQATLALSVHQVSHNTLLNLPQSERDADLRVYEDTTNKARACLEALATTDKAAARSLRVLSRLHENVRQSSTSPQDGPDMNTPQHGHQTNLQFQAPQQAMTSPKNAMLIPGPDGQQFNGTAGSLDHGTALDNVMWNEWGNMADPSFHMFFNSADNINNVFQGVGGFPGTLEQDDFAYQSNSAFMG
jgi:transcriptional regulatory protein GAL4